MASKFTVERSQVTYRTPYFDNDLVSLVYQTPAKLLHNVPALRLIADGNPALGKIGTDRGLAFRSVPGVNQALHWYQEFTFKAEYAYDYRMPQWLEGSTMHLRRLRPRKTVPGKAQSSITSVSGTVTNSRDG